VHAIAFAPQDALGGNLLNTPWESVATSLQTSVFTLKAISAGMRPHMRQSGGSIVSLTFDATVAWPIYDWMGVAKAGSVAHPVPRAGPRPGPDTGQHGLGRTATHDRGQGIPGFTALADGWSARAPLGWDVTDAAPVADTVAFLLSDLARGITGEMVHVDGGYHAIGSAPAGGEDEGSSEPGV
jgi:enoyl-[acyl-carrier protein] reductase I